MMNKSGRTRFSVPGGFYTYSYGNMIMIMMMAV